MENSLKMYHKLLSVILVSIIALPLYSQKKSAKNINDTTTIITIDATKITFGDLKKAFEKNSMSQGTSFEKISKDSAMDFINLYLNYKLKVIDGISKGLDKDSAIVAEVQNNRKLLAESYLLEQAIVEPAVKRYTELRKYDKKIALIMIPFSPSGDTAEAYKNITAALKELHNGGSFDFVARKYSTDTVTAEQGGTLPVYITGLKIQKVLEDAVARLRVGEYTKKPVKNDFGYFIIKLLDEKPREFIAISHILIPYSNDNPEKGTIIADSAAAKKLVDSLYLQLQQGADFKQLARKYSTDKLSAVKDGFIGIYSRSTGLKGSGEQIVTEVETAAFQLENNQVSKPITSKYGYHIIRRDSTVVFPADFEKDEIKTTYRKMYYKNDYEKYIDSLAVSLCKYKLNDANYRLLLSYYDSTKTTLDTSFANKIPADIKAKPLYDLLNKTYSIGDFIQNLIVKPELKVTATNNEGFKKAIHKLYEPVVLEEAVKTLDKQYPQFVDILNEFRDGILLFKMEEVNVWSKLKFDSAFARKFYDTTTMDLKRPAQYDISEIFMLSDTALNRVLSDIHSGKITFDSAATEYTQRNKYRDKKGHYGFVTADKNKLAQKAEELKLKEGNISEVFKYENGYSIVKLNKFEPARKKTFEEAIPDIAPRVQTIYQKKLDTAWLEALKKAHKVTINNKAINDIF